jgi:hypothetical protein
MLKISTSQNYAAANLDKSGRELFLSALLDHGTKPHKLLNSMICFDPRACFELVERRRANCARNNLALVDHGELNDHAIEVVAHNLSLLQGHYNSSA